MKVLVIVLIVVAIIIWVWFTRKFKRKIRKIRSEYCGLHGHDFIGRQYNVNSESGDATGFRYVQVFCKMNITFCRHCGLIDSRGYILVDGYHSVTRPRSEADLFRTYKDIHRVHEILMYDSPEQTHIHRFFMETDREWYSRVFRGYGGKNA